MTSRIAVCFWTLDVGLFPAQIVCCDFHFSFVPTGSPSLGVDVVVYVKDKNQPSLPTPFYSVLVSVSVFTALSTVFHSITSPDNSLLSHSSYGLISALLVPLTISKCNLFMKASLSPDYI